MREIQKERIERYIALTKEALTKAEVFAPERTHLRKIALDFRMMAESYYKDALHFKEKGNFVDAFACINYAHGWLDAGARLGVFECGGDDRLFTLAE